jgi:hypothetical protein
MSYFLICLYGDYFNAISLYISPSVVTSTDMIIPITVTMTMEITIKNIFNSSSFLCESFENIRIIYNNVNIKL